MLLFLLAISLHFAQADQVAYWQGLIIEKASKEKNGFKDLIKSINEDAAGMLIPTALKAKADWLYDSVKTPCSTYEGLAPASQLLRTEDPVFSKIRVGSETYLRSGIWQPYSIDIKNKKFNFYYKLEYYKVLPILPLWWRELIPLVPALEKGQPFLIVSSTQSGLKFSDNYQDYIPSKHREVQGTKEELARMPFSTVFFYEKENVRVQLPKSCL